MVDAELADSLASSLYETTGVRPSLHLNKKEPPAAGLSEIAVVIEFLANSADLISFFSDFARSVASDTSAQSVFQQVLRSGRRNKRGDRIYIPLIVELGHKRFEAPVRFHFHQSIDAKEFLRRLEKAREFVDTLPANAFMGQSGPPEYGFFWDVDADHWRGQIYGHTGDEDFWLPNGLLAEEE